MKTSRRQSEAHGRVDRRGLGSLLFDEVDDELELEAEEDLWSRGIPQGGDDMSTL